MNETHMMLWEC